MAEIHVQKKQHTNSTWIWILVALLIIAAVVYYITSRKEGNQNNTMTPTNTTSYLQSPLPSSGTSYTAFL